MNNILTYSEYRKQVRLYEENIVKEQILKPVNEGLFSGIRKKINTKASVFVREALADEIEMGKQLNEEIQEAVKELKEYIDKIQKVVDESNPEKTELMKKLEKIFEDIRKASFELLEILSGVEINFSDYVANATMAVFVNFGMLFIPTRSIFLLKKSYKYFIGLIKNTIRRDMLMLMLNFDQFENTVLIQSLEDNENLKKYDEIKSKMALVDEIQRRLLTDEGGRKRILSDKEMKKLSTVTNDIKKGIELQMKVNDRLSGSIGFDTRYDNTYTKTLDQLKNYVLEDDSKYLESIKNGMRSLALDEIDTKTFVELLISAAEECAYEVSAAIHTNFIDKVSVFKLANQKQLIEIVKKDKEAADKMRLEEEKKRKKELDEEETKKWRDFLEGDGSDGDGEGAGEEVFKKVVLDHETDGGKQAEEYENLGKIDTYKGKVSEKNILLSWLMLDDGKHWEENKDKIEPELKLYLCDLYGEDGRKLNNESYLDYVEKFLNLYEFALYEESKGGVSAEEETTSKERGKSADTKKTPKTETKSHSETAKEETKTRIEYSEGKGKEVIGFSLKQDDLSKNEKKQFKELISDYDDEDKKFIFDEKKQKRLKTIIKLINENLLSKDGKIDVDTYMDIIEGICKIDDKTKEIIDDEYRYRNSKKIMSNLEQIRKRYNENEYIDESESSGDSKEKGE